ncbi:MAG: hypothetical protein K2H96_01790, partial [Muribaculaceae bacterium]|nr:hypothetical protein [Muribaculaceae bacterium]
HGTLEREVWRPVKGYEGLYEVSSFGRVKSLEKDVYYSDRGYTRRYPEMIMKQHITAEGYCSIGLTKDKQHKSYQVHRLVMEAFVPNPDNLPCVNHRNEKPDCNYPDNMEWCTVAYNNTYGTKVERVAAQNRIEVCQYDMSGKLLKVWEGSRKAGETLGLDGSNIVKCCKGKSKFVGGFIWRNVGDAFDKYPLPQPKKEKVVKVKQPTAYEVSVDQYDQDGNLIATYPTIYEAEKNAPTTRAGIVNCCNGKLVTSGKCIWRYEGEPFDKYPTKVERTKRVTSEATKEKLRQTNLNSDYTKKVSKPVEAYDKEGVLVVRFPSLGEAIRAHGSGVVKALKGEYKQHHGLIWKRLKPNVL